MNSFIAQYDGQFSADLTDRLIRILNESVKLNIANQGRSGMHSLDSSVKESTDLDLTVDLGIEAVDKSLLRELKTRLYGPVTHYVNNCIISKEGKKDYVDVKEVVKQFILLQPPKLKVYRAPNQGYHAWHQDWGLHELQARRLIVAMVYLNDVEEGGETAFFHQNVKIRPKKGRMLIFPPYFTHMHKGMRPISNDKYICNFYIGMSLTGE